MVFVAREMERRGFKVPLLIGGATTSRQHTAVKIAPEYGSATVHVLDASRAVDVVSRLLSPSARDGFDAEEQGGAGDPPRAVWRPSRQAAPVLRCGARQPAAARTGSTSTFRRRGSSACGPWTTCRSRRCRGTSTGRSSSRRGSSRAASRRSSSTRSTARRHESSTSTRACCSIGSRLKSCSRHAACTASGQRRAKMTTSFFIPTTRGATS